MGDKIDKELHQNRAEKIETCYICGVEFDINKEDNSHYHYGKYPMCESCSEYYGFYNLDK